MAVQKSQRSKSKKKIRNNKTILKNVFCNKHITTKNVFTKTAKNIII